MFDQLAHGVDFDLRQPAGGGFAFGGFGGEFVEVGVAVLRKQMARGADAAGFAVSSGVFAQQRLRQMAGEGGFAGAAFAGKQHGVRQTLPLRGNLPPFVFVPGINHGAGGETGKRGAL